MKRAQRLDHFRDDLATAEKESLQRLGQAQHRLREARERLAELERYRADYLQTLNGRALAGMGAQSLRDFQTFVARLGEAVRQQTQLVGRCEAECEFERTRWSQAALQVRALQSVVNRWQQEETLVGNRIEQREMDERARDVAQRRIQELANADDRNTESGSGEHYRG
jgi:flagellar FliJ protein